MLASTLELHERFADKDVDILDKSFLANSMMTKPLSRVIWQSQACEAPKCYKYPYTGYHSGKFIVQVTLWGCCQSVTFEGSANIDNKKYCQELFKQ